MEQKNKQPRSPAAPKGRPVSKEEYIARMVEQDPRKAAEVLREILKKR